MAKLTTNRNHPDLGHGADDKPMPQQKVYLVLPETELEKGFVKPYRRSYRHKTCGETTTMSRSIAETYARDPWFYGSTYCIVCRMHRPLSEFVWNDGEPMDPRLQGEKADDKKQGQKAAETGSTDT